jgi:hypothetical protein
VQRVSLNADGLPSPTPPFTRPLLQRFPQREARKHCRYTTVQKEGHIVAHDLYFSCFSDAPSIFRPPRAAQQHAYNFAFWYTVQLTAALTVSSCSTAFLMRLMACVSCQVSCPGIHTFSVLGPGVRALGGSTQPLTLIRAAYMMIQKGWLCRNLLN